MVLSEGELVMLVKSRKFAAPALASQEAAGVTLIEVVVAAAILVVAVLGASGYRYYAAIDVRKAGLQRTAAAIALTLCENWRGRGYDHTTDFNPVAHLSGASEGFVITASGDVGPPVPTELLFTLLTPLNSTFKGKCQIIADGVHYWATLSWKDLPPPDPPPLDWHLRALNVVVGWKPAGSAAEIHTYDANAKLFKLTTYVSD